MKSNVVVARTARLPGAASQGGCRVPDKRGGSPVLHADILTAGDAAGVRFGRVGYGARLSMKNRGVQCRYPARMLPSTRFSLGWEGRCNFQQCRHPRVKEDSWRRIPKPAPDT